MDDLGAEQKQKLLTGIVRETKQRIATISTLALRGVANLPATWRDRESREQIAFAAAGFGGGLVWKSFVVLVLAPTMLFGLYSALWESHGYVSEARVTVRAAQEQRGALTDAASLVGKLSGGAKSTQQDSYIVLNYIKSEAVINDLGGRAYMEKAFSRPDIDYFSRLATKLPVEDIFKYWTRRVAASVDTVSGILTLKITAFRPEDSLKVARDVLRVSENLVNTISIRNRADAVERARQEVDRSAQALAAVRQQLLQFRNENDLVDPASRAASVSEMISKLTLEKIGLENTLSTLSDKLANDSPSQRFQQSKLTTLNEQIAKLKDDLTSLHTSKTVASQLGAYERLKLEEQFAEKVYTISQNVFLKARQELDKQQLYLALVVAPSLPEATTYPRVGASVLLLFASLSIIWAIGALIVASINDQMA